MKIINLLVAGLVLFHIGGAYAYDDFQVWNTDSEELKANQNIKIVLEQEFRWKDVAKEFYYHHYDLGFFYNLEYLSVGGGYRHVFSKSNGKFLEENEPYVAATLMYGTTWIKLEDRSRIEYNHFDYKNDTWRFRNKFSIKFPWKFTIFEIQPYLSDEIFVLFGDKKQGLNSNRFSAGFEMLFIKNLKTEIYYMLQSSKGSEWINSNILGIKLKLIF